jgi:hypothetical protein
MNDKALAAIMQMEVEPNMTRGQKYNPAMEIVSQEMADVYFKALVNHNMTHWGQTREEAIQVELSNLVYYSRYYDSNTLERVCRLFKEDLNVHSTE